MKPAARLTLVASAIIAAGVIFRFISTPSVVSVELATPADIQAGLADILVVGECVTAAEADERIPALLAALGYDEWIVTSENDVAPSDCVTSAVIGHEQRVLLVQTLTPEVIATLEEVAYHLLDHCLGRDAAMEYVTGRLRDAGASGYQIRTDGPLAAPSERWADAMRDYEAGCYLYTGTGRLDDGTRVYYVTGR